MARLFLILVWVACNAPLFAVNPEIEGAEGGADGLSDAGGGSEEDECAGGV
jgi:hypothetical protein